MKDPLGVVRAYLQNDLPAISNMGDLFLLSDIHGTLDRKGFGDKLDQFYCDLSMAGAQMGFMTGLINQNLMPKKEIFVMWRIKDLIDNAMVLKKPCYPHDIENLIGEARLVLIIDDDFHIGEAAVYLIENLKKPYSLKALYFNPKQEDDASVKFSSFLTAWNEITPEQRVACLKEWTARGKREAAPSGPSSDVPVPGNES